MKSRQNKVTEEVKLVNKMHNVRSYLPAACEAYILTVSFLKSSKDRRGNWVGCVIPIVCTIKTSSLDVIPRILVIDNRNLL